MSNIINFNDIIGREQPETTVVDGSIRYWLEYGKNMLDDVTTHLTYTWNICSQVCTMAEEMCKKAGVNEVVYASGDFASICSTPFSELAYRITSSENNSITFAVGNTDAGIGHCYVIKARLSVDEKCSYEDLMDDPMKIIMVHMGIFRVYGWSCELFTVNGEWKKISWEEYTGLTRKQYEDAVEDAACAEMLDEILHINGTVTNKEWEAIKKDNDLLLTLYRDPEVSPMLCLMAFETVAEGNFVPELHPVDTKCRGLSFSMNGGKLCVYINDGFKRICAGKFADIDEAKAFIKKHLDFFSNGMYSVVFPLSKDKVIRKRFMGSFTDADLDEYVKNNFDSLNKKETQLLDFARSALQEFAEEAEFMP